jgi:DNA polymerase delta subunit 2
MSENDSLILEDETGRTTLLCAGKDEFKPSHFITGVVTAVKGKALPGGEFEVEDICFSGLAPQPKFPASPKSEKKKFIAFISGIKIGDVNQQPIALQLVVDYLCGHLGSSNDIASAAQVCKLIVAGDIIRPPEDNGFDLIANPSKVKK